MHGLLNNNKGKVLFLPIFFAATVSNVLDCVSMLLDEMIIGNLFDDAAFGAINVIEPYQLVESFLSYMICIGGVAMIIRADGERSQERINDLFSHCITSCLLLGVISFAVYSVFGRQMVDAVSGGTEANPYVLEAISWNRLDALVEPAYIFLFTYILLRGGSMFALLVTIIEISSNFVMSVALGKAMGIGGVVLATGIAFCIGIFLILLFLFLRKENVTVRPYFDAGLTGKLSVISFPESSFIISVAFMEAVVNNTALLNYGIRGIAVAAVVINMFEIVIYVAEGITQYETASLNQYLGQGDNDRVSECIRVTIRAAVLEGLVISALYFMFAEDIVSIFDINDPATFGSAVSAAEVIAVIPIVICFTRILAVFFQYTKRTGRAAFLVIMSWGLLPALGGWLLGRVSLDGITWGVALGASAALFLMILYVRIRKKEKVWALNQ